MTARWRRRRDVAPVEPERTRRRADRAGPVPVEPVDEGVALVRGHYLEWWLAGLPEEDPPVWVWLNLLEQGDVADLQRAAAGFPGVPSHLADWQGMRSQLAADLLLVSGRDEAFLRRLQRDVLLSLDIQGRCELPTPSQVLVWVRSGLALEARRRPPGGRPTGP